MWKFISLLIALLILCGGLIIWMTLLARTGASQDEIIFTNEDFVAEQEKQEQDKQEQSQKAEKEQEIATNKRAFYIAHDECEKECTSFTKNTEGWRYCANICGIIKENHDTDICDDKTTLSRDYCYVQKSIDNRDITLCDEIADKGIRENCIQQTKEQILDAF